ncbi:MAG: hypothetical protein ACXWUG_12005 [Polyangiales bacterium]
MRAWLLLALACGCAPMAEMRPGNGMMVDRTFEAGGGVVNVRPRPYVTESSSTTGLAWFSGNPSRFVTLTGISTFAYETDNDGNRTFRATGGGAVRLNWVRHDRIGFATELQAGWGWGALVLPIAVRLFDQTWIYASPRLGTINRYLSYGTPLGISVRVWDGLMIRLETQTSWEDFKYYNRRQHYAAGIAYQF